MKINPLKNLTKALILSLIVLTIGLTSCNSKGRIEARDTQKCLESVKKLYPNAKIYKRTDSKFQFYVLHNDELRLVTTLNQYDAEIDNISVLILVSE